MLGLHHLDDMPVTPKERRLAIAFLQGGLEVSHYLMAARRFGVGSKGRDKVKNAGRGGGENAGAR